MSSVEVFGLRPHRSTGNNFIYDSNISSVFMHLACSVEKEGNIPSVLQQMIKKNTITHVFNAYLSVNISSKYIKGKL